MASPWAVLGFCAARALGNLHWSYELPDLIGPGSLNFNALLIGTSSGGKGAAQGVAESLMPDGPPVFAIGTGEGMIDAFFYEEEFIETLPGKKPNDDPIDVTKTRQAQYDSVMFVASEIDAFSAVHSRNGSTASVVLRNGFSGEQLGFTYRSTKGHVVPARQYRMTVVIAAQPERLTGILDEAGGGLPQRFLWLPAVDLRTTRDNWEHHRAALKAEYGDQWVLINGGYPTGPAQGSFGSHSAVGIPDITRDAILDNHEKKTTGDGGGLDGHAMFAREKFALALAYLDNRFEMTEEDWRLSGVAAEVSSIVQEYALSELGAAQRQQAVDHGRLLGQRLAAADRTKAGEEKMHAAVITRVLDLLDEAGDDGMSTRDLRRGVTPSARGHLDEVISVLAARGAIRSERSGRGQRWFITRA